MNYPTSVSEPTAIVCKQKAHKNIAFMKALADRDKVRLRPHFKTHQSLEIGSWFREYGVSVCAVSSPSMARKFVDGGWVDVLIALPANLGSSADYNELSKKAKLGLIGDSVELIRGVDSSLEHDVDFWIEVDAGYGRTGVKWDDKEKEKWFLKSFEAVKDYIGALSVKGKITDVKYWKYD